MNAKKKVLSVSMLMSLYWKEKPEWFRLSLESIEGQSQLPEEVVLVLDGPIGDKLKVVIKDFEERWRGTEEMPIRLRVVKLRENRGLGLALAEGLRHCSHELVARMDTDDIMMPQRLERQAVFMERHRDVAVCGAWIDEFVEENGKRVVMATRKLPERHDAILAFGRGRNPMNHPVVMFRKSRVENVGSYEHFPLFEDYFLWAKMLTHGDRFHNLQESLLWFRQNKDTYRRRGGFKYACDEVRFQCAICKLGLISPITAAKNICIRFGVRVMPNAMREVIYKKLLRK